MEDDDLMPNNSTYFNFGREPKEQIIERKKERAKTLEKQDILKEILNHLDKRIAFYTSVDSITNDVLDDPDKFMHQYSANLLTRDNLMSEKEWILSLKK